MRTRDPSIVDGVVDAAKGLHASLDHSLHIILKGDIAYTKTALNSRVQLL
jgi:hypothetical protein